MESWGPFTRGHIPPSQPGSRRPGRTIPILRTRRGNLHEPPTIAVPDHAPRVGVQTHAGPLRQFPVCQPRRQHPRFPFAQLFAVIRARPADRGFARCRNVSKTPAVRIRRPSQDSRANAKNRPDAASPARAAVTTHALLKIRPTSRPSRATRLSPPTGHHTSPPAHASGEKEGLGCRGFGHALRSR